MAQAGSSATDAGPGAGAFPASTESAEPVAASPMPESPAPVAAAAADPGRAKAAGALRFVFDEESWVEVIQADGRVLMSQINPAGTERTLAGDPPLKVVIGNASAVTVEYRGKRVDLAPRTSIENVARLTLD
jgi:cytoskeleton protein RodZ